MVFALARMKPPSRPRYGAQRSRVLNMVTEAKKELNKTLPRENARRPHAGAQRGRAAVIARRLGKRKKTEGTRGPQMDEGRFKNWCNEQFEVRQMNLEPED